MNEPENLQLTSLTAAQEFLQALWEKHMQCELVSHDTEDTLGTMVEDAYVNHIPVLTGGVGRGISYGSSTPSASFPRCLPTQS